MEAEGKGGEIVVGAAGKATLRLGALGDLIVTELNGRFYEQNAKGRLFAGGMALTAINNATFTSATTGATATPIAGIWNPLNSGVDAVIDQAILALTMTALQATGPGPFVWMGCAGEGKITTGNAPTSLKTLNAGGSQVKDMSGVPLTGLAGVLRFLRAAALNGGSASNAAFLATAVAMQTQAPAPPAENVDGGIIVPPGGVLALMATTTAVAHSAVSGLVWAEQPHA